MSARDRREARSAAAASPLTDEQRAFLHGKRARENGQHERMCPPGPRDERAAWLRGYRYQNDAREGLRPLDTARRIP